MTSKLKDKMARLGVSQAELARRTGIDTYRVSRYVNRCANPNPQTLAKFAAALGCEPAELQEQPAADVPHSGKAVARD
ncbi:MAG: XRE family transcriptional regulator [Opitutae bacterium]|nr:XRE family transcriptional regulator [Opitutae bacterium]